MQASTCKFTLGLLGVKLLLGSLGSFHRHAYTGANLSLGLLGVRRRIRSPEGKRNAGDHNAGRLLRQRNGSPHLSCRFPHSWKDLDQL